MDREGVAKLSLIDVALDHAYATPSGACYCFRIFSEMHDREAITIQGAIGMPRATVRARKHWEWAEEGGGCVCMCAGFVSVHDVAPRSVSVPGLSLVSTCAHMRV